MGFAQVVAIVTNELINKLRDEDFYQVAACSRLA